MRLVQPTDFEILVVLSDGKRNTAANIAVEIGKDRDYINTRLPTLADYDLLRKVGPAPHSGIYVITSRGYAALAARDEYSRDTDFEAVITAQL